MKSRKIPFLKNARVLVSNDDGINATGIKVLERALKGLAKEVWVVAPEHENSGAGHALTLQRPLRIRHVRGKRYAVDGTPTDCALLAINQIMRDNRPDIVLSGVNYGGNLGNDVTYSGTVAVAMESTIFGIPAIAFSQHVENFNNSAHWSTAETWIPKVLRKLEGVGLPESVLLNVNFPDVVQKKVTGVEVKRQGAMKTGDNIKQGFDPLGRPYYWIGWMEQESRYGKGTDLDAMERGAVSITPLTIDLTHKGLMRDLKKVFA